MTLSTQQILSWLASIHVKASVCDCVLGPGATGGLHLHVCLAGNRIGTDGTDRDPVLSGSRSNRSTKNNNFSRQTGSYAAKYSICIVLYDLCAKNSWICPPFPVQHSKYNKFLETCRLFLLWDVVLSNNEVNMETSKVSKIPQSNWFVLICSFWHGELFITKLNTYIQHNKNGAIEKHSLWMIMTNMVTLVQFIWFWEWLLFQRKRPRYHSLHSKCVLMLEFK